MLIVARTPGFDAAAHLEREGFKRSGIKTSPRAI